MTATDGNFSLNQPPAKKNSLLRKRLWKIRGDIPKPIYLLALCLSILVILLVWSILTYGGFVKAIVLPSPTAVLQRGAELLQDGSLLVDTKISLRRVALGFLLSALLSIPLGLLIGSFKGIHGLVGWMVEALRYIPPAAFLPISIVWLGFDEAQKIAIIFLGTFFYNTLMIANAVKFVSGDLIRVSYTLGATEKNVFCDVIFPATLPKIIDVLRTNVATAWNALVIAELVAADAGLGHSIINAQRHLKPEDIFVVLFVIGSIGLITDLMFKLVFRLVVPWSIEK